VWNNKKVNPVDFCQYVNDSKTSLVLALESCVKESNAASIRSPVVDEEMLRPGDWLKSVLCVLFGAPTLLVA